VRWVARSPAGVALSRMAINDRSPHRSSTSPASVSRTRTDCTSSPDSNGGVLSVETWSVKPRQRLNVAPLIEHLTSCPTRGSSRVAVAALWRTPPRVREQAPQPGIRRLQLTDAVVGGGPLGPGGRLRRGRA
jgi:hypothetical protein